MKHIILLLFFLLPSPLHAEEKEIVFYYEEEGVNSYQAQAISFGMFDEIGHTIKSYLQVSHVPFMFDTKEVIDGMRITQGDMFSDPRPCIRYAFLWTCNLETIHKENESALQLWVIIATLPFFNANPSFLLECRIGIVLPIFP